MMNLEGNFQFLCPICEMPYPSQADVMTHMKFHGGQEYLCVVCDRYFEGKHELSHHLRIHPACFYCKTKVFDHNEYAKHTLEHHLDLIMQDGRVCFDTNYTGKKKTRCRICARVFPHRLYALLHARFAHMLAARLI
ncbi:unnamed protein product [Blepharisma stoltei]|uniref:C2H2-type domain-containing protein n=1 Tax=Blepharisma stoltei TaxID=1481888 RepID=A0AAU9I563_9CILI|nr:unnamed protein product [Blepharisma stoltei]